MSKPGGMTGSHDQPLPTLLKVYEPRFDDSSSPLSFTVVGISSSADSSDESAAATSFFSGARASRLASEVSPDSSPPQRRRHLPESRRARHRRQRRSLAPSSDGHGRERAARDDARRADHLRHSASTMGVGNARAFAAREERRFFVRHRRGRRYRRRPSVVVDARRHQSSSRARRPVARRCRSNDRSVRLCLTRDSRRVATARTNERERTRERRRRGCFVKRFGNFIRIKYFS